MTSVNPTPSNDRILLLDALRGFALFGILFANITFWGGLEIIGDASRAALSSEAALEAAAFVELAVLQGKFYTIFSFLFGLGFALQIARLQDRGADGMAIFRRRMMVLLVIGLLHMLLLYRGDIVTLYALLGFILPLFNRFSDRTLILSGIALLFVPVVMVLLEHATGIMPADYVWSLIPIVGDALGGKPKDTILEFLQTADLHQYSVFRVVRFIGRWESFLWEWRPFKVLGIMLIGMAAGRALLRGQLAGNRSLWIKVALFGLAVGVPANVAFYHFDGFGMNEEARLRGFILYAIGVVPLGLAYAALFALAFDRSRMLDLLAPMGRMALTNYILQSVLATLIFFPFGLGLMGTLGPWQIWGVALAILLGQLALSHWWLSRHAQGPLEHLWRQATYRSR